MHGYWVKEWSRKASLICSMHECQENQAGKCYCIIAASNTDKWSRQQYWQHVHNPWQRSASYNLNNGWRALEGLKTKKQKAGDNVFSQKQESKEASVAPKSIWSKIKLFGTHRTAIAMHINNILKSFFQIVLNSKNLRERESWWKCCTRFSWVLLWLEPTLKWFAEIC